MFPFHLVATFLWMSMSLSWAQTTTSSPSLRLFTLTSSIDNVVKDVTQNVSLECAFNKNITPAQTSLSELIRIRILKADENDHWNILAEIKQYEVGIHLYDNILGSGQVDSDILASYLRITWPTATATTFGRYRCDVPAFDNNFDYVIEKSNIVVVVEHSITAQNVLNLLLVEQNRFQHEWDTDIKLVKEHLKSLNQSIYDCQSVDNTLMTLNQSLASNFQSTENKINDLYNLMITLNQTTDEKYNNLYQLMSTLNQSVRSSHYNYQPWPEGVYSLLEPVTGCPGDGEWRKGYHKVHTESGKAQTQNAVSSPSHLPPYTLTSQGGNHCVVLNFCSKDTSTSGVFWPTGSYCIHNSSPFGSCPPGFDVGDIVMDLESSGYHNSYGGSNPNFSPSSSSHWYSPSYCCRSDGSVTTPIDLPTAYPFYLYRFKGTCQLVTNMQVSHEYIIIATADTGNDKYKNQYHPDGSLNPVRLELCYYTRTDN